MTHFRIVAFFLLILTRNVYAGSDVNDFSITHYDTENGLPQNSVRAIASDESGFYWLATEMGLVRFDGRAFKLFDNSNTGIHSNRFSDIIKDPVSGGLIGVNSLWSMLPIKNGAATLSDKKIQDYFGMTNVRLSPHAYYHKSWKFNQEKSFYFEQDSTLLPVSRDAALLVTKRKVYWFLSGKKIAECPISNEFELRSAFNIGEILYIVPVNGNNFKAQSVTPKGIFNIALKGDILFQKKFAPRIICVNNASGQTFIFSDDCLYLVEADRYGNLNTKLILSGFDFQKKAITIAHYNEELGMLMLGSKVDGLYVFKRKYFRTKVAGNSVSSNNSVDNALQDQVIYNDSSILTDKGIVFSTGKQEPYFLPETRTAMKYWGNKIIKTKNFIWALSGNTLYQYTPGANHLIHKWILNFSVSELAEVKGQLWMGTYEGKIFSLDYRDTNSQPRLVCTIKPQIQTIRAYHEHAWIGTSSGLFRLGLNDRKLTSFKLLEGKTVRGFYPLGNNELWICTYDAGLYLYQNDIIKHFPPDENNHLNTVHHVLEDSKGYLWMSTNHGIFQVPKKDLLGFNAKSASVPYYLHYDKEAGFISNEFNGGNDRSGLILPNKFFCFSSMKGWVFFNPDSIKEMLPDAKVIIDRIEIGNKEVLSASTLLLEHDFDPVTVNIATPYFGNPDNLKFEYRFDDNKWITMRNDQVTFNEMSSGAHTLDIRKRTGFGNKYATITLHIKVKPAWWETWIFRAGLLLLITILLWLAFRLRFYLLKKRNRNLKEAVEIQTQKLEEHINALKRSEEKLSKENKFQQRLTKHIAHDIRTPLKYLTFSSKHLHQFLKQKGSLKENDALEIYTSSEQIYHFTGRLISYLHAWTVTSQPKEYVNIFELTEQKFRIFGLAVKEQNIEWINLVPERQTIFSHSVLIDILMHNIIDNSIKNTVGGIVKIEHETLEHHDIIIISDTGCGISPEELKEYNEYLNDENKTEHDTYTGLGFSIIKNILPLIDTQITLSPNQPQGTVIRVAIRKQKE